MFVGREWQGMFVEARGKVVKSINLAKCVKRDIEKWPALDQELQESLTSLKVTKDANECSHFEWGKFNFTFLCLYLGYSFGSEAPYNSGDRGFPAGGRRGRAVVHRDRSVGGHTIEDPRESPSGLQNGLRLS